MRLNQPNRERRSRLKSTELGTAVESVENPYTDLENLLSPEVRAQFVRQLQEFIDAHEMAYDSRRLEVFSTAAMAASILNQVLDEPALPPQMQRKITGFVPDPSFLVDGLPKGKSLIPYYTWNELAQVRIIFPEEAHLIKITDEEFQVGVDHLKDQPNLIAQRAGMSDPEIGELFLALAILRPDKQAELMEALLDPQVCGFLFKTKDPDFGNGSSSIAAAARLVDPTYELSPTQRNKLLRSYREVMRDEIIGPKLFGMADLAILLAPKVTLTEQGQIILDKLAKKMAEPRPLPDRPI